MERGRRHMSATVADGRLGSTGPTETIGRFLQDNPEVRVQPGRSAVAAPQGGVRRARLWRVFPRRIPTMGYHSVGTTAGDRRLAIWANGGGGLRGRRRQLGGWAAVPVPGPRRRRRDVRPSDPAFAGAIRYRIRTPGRNGPLGPVVLAGPSCDSSTVSIHCVPSLCRQTTKRRRRHEDRDALKTMTL